MINHTATLLGLRNRLLSVSGLPSANNRGLSNKEFTPTPGTPYVKEDFVPPTGVVLTIPADRGTTEARGLYVVRWYGLQKTGITAIYAGVDAILAAFSPGTIIALTTGDAVRICGAPHAPYAGQLVQADGGWAVVEITIPYWFHTSNAIAA